MNSSSEYAQGSLRATTLTSMSQAAIESSMGWKWNFRSRIACYMIFCLQYLGCDIESIFRVLQSYNLGGTISDVARYIEEGQLLQHSETMYPPNCRKLYYRSTGTTLEIDFAQGKPVQLVLSANCISPLSSRKLVTIVTLDGQKLITVAVDGHLRICTWDRLDFITMDRSP